METVDGPARGLHRTEGHKVMFFSCVEAVTSKCALIDVLSVYMRSLQKTGKRPQREVDSAYASVCRETLLKELPCFIKKRKLRLRPRSALPEKSPQDLPARILDETAQNTGMTFAACGQLMARAEPTRAAVLSANQIAEGVAGVFADSVTCSRPEELYTAGLLDPDLLIQNVRRAEAF